MTDQTKHWSDCAVHSEPAYPKGECDCGGYTPEQEPRIPLFEVMSNALELYEFDQSTENHGALMLAVHNYVEDKEKPDDGYCQACDGDSCTARKGCVALDNPQPKREWVGLTFDEVDECFSRDPRVAIRNAEAKLKEKNT